MLAIRDIIGTPVFMEDVRGYIGLDYIENKIPGLMYDLSDFTEHDELRHYIMIVSHEGEVKYEFMLGNFCFMSRSLGEVEKTMLNQIIGD